MKRLTSLVGAALLIPALAFAQPKTPDDWYKEGETQYNLGNFDKAVDAFKQGFALETNDSKKSAYLYNIAQAYRQNKNCKDAQFFYKRFLALKENDTVKPLKPQLRADIEGRIAELDECAKQQEMIRNKPPDSTLPPDGDKGGGDKATGDKVTGAKVTDKRVGDAGAGDGGDGDGEDGGSVTKAAVTGAPHVISLRFEAGGAKLKTGDLTVPIQATFALLAGYPLAINDKLTLDLGGAFTFTPVPYDAMGTSKSAQLIGLLADVGATYSVASKIGLRADVGLGALLFSGVSESPFTAGAPTTGALTMLHVRVGVSADYAITPNLIATLTPFAFSYSPAKTGLRADITSITAIDFMLGLGYRM